MNTSRERRHQIPGLRQTPYLKVYLLRCEDTDTYKTTSRKLLREWVKEHTPPSQSSSSFNKAENHDAFEWLIVHVTSPISDQGKGSRNSDGAKGDSHTERTPSASRWSNRSSSSVIEKIRSDFNSTSKTGIDRVAQVYVSEIQPPNTSSDKQQQDDSQGFKDLISKLKFLILTSFDQRVSQYEEDIREKDSQRTLPGWNFNTFFVLKEGLARGFESVGLIEDALTSYHELSMTLNVTVAEHPSKSSDDHASPFRDFTDDLSGIFKQAINAIGDDVVGPDDIRVSQDLGALILDTSRKPYREMILENNITAFDFLCYVFARQISLQLRLANAILLNQDYPANGEPSKRHRNSISRELEEEPEIENLLILADICRQTIEFITFICPIIRDDLRASLNIPAQNAKEQRVSDEIDLYSIIENIVASWTYSACQCILEKTSTQSLSTRMQPLLRQFKAHSSYDTVQSQDEKGVKPVVGTNLPPRTSSLITQAPHPGMPSSPEKFPSLTSLDAVRLLPPTSSQTGFQELAAERADVYGMARRCLGSLGLRNSGWKGGWSDLALVQSTEDRLDEVSLADDYSDRPEVSTETQRSPGSHMAGIRNRALLSALMSKTTFYKTYEVNPIVNVKTFNT